MIKNIKTLDINNYESAETQGVMVNGTHIVSHFTTMTEVTKEDEDGDEHTDTYYHTFVTVVDMRDNDAPYMDKKFATLGSMGRVGEFSQFHDVFANLYNGCCRQLGITPCIVE